MFIAKPSPSTSEPSASRGGALASAQRLTGVAIDAIECIQRLIGQLHATQAHAVVSTLTRTIDELSALRRGRLHAEPEDPGRATLRRLDLIVEGLTDDLSRARIVLLRPSTTGPQVLEMRATLFGAALETIQRIRTVLGPRPAPSASARTPVPDSGGFPDTWPGAL